MDHKKLSIRLIREQIRNQLLISALENLGFDCNVYALNISEEILLLAGFQQISDSLYQEYFDMIDKALEKIDYSNFDEKSVEFAETIYCTLQEIKLKGSLF